METAALGAGISPGFAGLLGGMTGGVAQAYATMGKLFCLGFFYTLFRVKSRAFKRVLWSYMDTYVAI